MIGVLVDDLRGDIVLESPCVDGAGGVVDRNHVGESENASSAVIPTSRFGKRTLEAPTSR